MFSDVSSYPLRAGAVIPIPLMYYNPKVAPIQGSQPDRSEESTNGSTLLTITKVTGETYDATLSGNIGWLRQPDTLRFGNGIIQNALLPIRR